MTHAEQTATPLLDDLVVQIGLVDTQSLCRGVQRLFQVLTFEFAFLDHRITPFAQPLRGEGRAD